MNSPHPTRFSADKYSAGAVNSIEILGTGTRDVEINVPLKAKGVLSSFDNAVAIGSALGATGNALGVTGNATVGGTVVAGNATVSGVLKAPQLRITGTDANDGVTIQKRRWYRGCQVPQRLQVPVQWEHLNFGRCLYIWQLVCRGLFGGQAVHII